MKSVIIFIIAVVSLMGYGIVSTDRSANNGGYSTVAMPKHKELKKIKIKAVLNNGDTIEYYSASDVRCDELYKYEHFVGMGHIVGWDNKEVCLYQKNDPHRLITVEQMLAEQTFNNKIREKK